MRTPLFTMLLLATACAAEPPSPAPSIPQPAPAFQASPAALPGITDDAARFVQKTAAARFEALRGLLQERGIAFEVQEFTNEKRARDPRGRNVVINIGNGPRDLIVGAHYDAVALADGSLVPGMVDDAAAVVVLLRVAQRLGRQSLKHRVRIVLFDMEEEGLLGSKEFVAHDKERIAAMVNVDIAGYGDTLLIGTAASYPPVQRAVRRVCAEANFGCVEYAQLPPGDDRSFEKAGIPNVSLAVLPLQEAHQLWLMLNAPKSLRDDGLPAIIRVIHSANDSVDKLDAAAMTRMHDAVLGIVLELDRTIR